uniref:Lipocalin n=1 Tax=Rhipicephalus zambeziensis TaxID=60191 RepID=A0A224YM33_9ACAR
MSFFDSNRRFWVTRGNATPDICSWYNVSSLTNTTVEFELGTGWNNKEQQCRSVQLTYYFGENDKMFKVSEVVGFGYFYHMVYSDVYCAVVKGVEWDQTNDMKSKKCEETDGDLNPFPTEPCCYANNTEKLRTSPMASWIGKLPERNYCSRFSNAIYVTDRNNVPKDCTEKYDKLKKA